MSKQRIMPAGHWDWSMPVTLSQGWKLDDLLFVGGQISADNKGRTIGDDIETQTRNIMEFIGRVLHEAGADYGDIVKQNVYYVVDDESPPPAEIMQRINAVRAEYCGSPAPITTETPVAGLAFEGLLLEIDAVAMVGQNKVPLAPANHWAHGDDAPYVQGWRAGDWVFVGGQRSLDGNGALRDAGDIVAQTRNCFEGMKAVLAEAGASLDDLMRLNTYYQQDGSGHEVTEFWEEMTKVRMDYLPNPGPVGTGLRVKGFPHEGELFQIEGIAYLGKERRRIMPEGHWDWSMPVPFSQGWRIGDVVFVGGQISADQSGRTVGPGDIAVQTKNVFESLITVLREAGAEMSDVVKMNTYYQYEGKGTNVTEYWEKMTEVRRGYFPPEAASATAVRVDGYAFEDLLIEVEAIAVIDR
jgi:enamine deaminase RidA (YjgF/YER057c/UK114 family)